MLKEPLVIVLAIILFSCIVAWCITMWQERRKEKRLKETRGSYLNDGIWGVVKNSSEKSVIFLINTGRCAIINTLKTKRRTKFKAEFSSLKS